MLSYIAGSFSTDLNVWERMAGPCVSQEVCHSATTVSVVWLLALDLIFTRCVSACPRISMLDVVQTGGLLDRSRTGAFDFSRLFKCGSFPTFRVETHGHLQLHTLSRRDHMMMLQVTWRLTMPFQAECCRHFKSCRSGRTQAWRLGYEMSGSSTASNPFTPVDS